MAKTVNAANRHRLWIFGKSIDFQIVTTTMALTQVDYAHVGGNPRRAPKRQITLHCTAGRGSAEQVVSWWNNPASGAAGAHIVVERTSTAQAARPAPTAQLRDDRSWMDQNSATSSLVDVVRVADEDMIVYHGNDLNQSSIGIEIVNASHGWYIPTVADEPSLAGRHPPPIGNCPAPLNIGSTANPNLVCNHARPGDLNRFIRENQFLNGDFQSFEDAQYAALILLLRHLCIQHRIPRQFLGFTPDEVFRHWMHEPTGAANAAMRRVNQSRIRNFRGIFHHRNCSPDKPCPGVLHRNRLYRGLIDEWWLPVDLEGQERGYYTGPFEDPPWVSGQPTRNSLFKARNTGRLDGTVLRDADVVALSESRSQFDLDRIDHYYAAVETGRGGLFPIGLNKVWHGGVHFHPPGPAHWVYAAASGTIVAARLSSHTDTDRHELFGSQRFVLIQHSVHLETEPDPSGTGTRINYQADPVILFTLYMHLEAFANLAAENEQNPPWFNAWRRRHPNDDIGLTADGERGRVFAPDIPVMVGDVLGSAGTFRGQRMIHFEVISHRDRELSMAPWNQPDLRAHDADGNLICNVPALDRFLRDQVGDGLDLIDLLRAAPFLRSVKARHLSSWALTDAAQIEPLVPHVDRRTALWPHFRRFSWVADAAQANPQVRDLLGSDGMFWHYHPVTFMQKVNTLILGENREIPEAGDPSVNVLVSEDYFLTHFVAWNAAQNRFLSATADAASLQPQDGQHFDFTRQDIACREGAGHSAPYDAQQETRVSLALVEVLQSIRAHYNQAMSLRHAFVCQSHGYRRVTGRGPHQDEFEILGRLGNHDHAAREMEEHLGGVALDYAPAAATPASCLRLWQSTVAITDILNRVCPDGCGTPTAANLPEGYRGFAFRAFPASADAKLRASPVQALSAAEAASFEIHLALIPESGYQANLVTLTVIFEELEILDDQDTFASGEWQLLAHVNGELAGRFMESATTGQRISLEDLHWRRNLLLNPVWGETVAIRTGGRELDVIEHDPLGTATLQFGENSDPAWGIGRHTLTSSNGSYRVHLRIERS